ncbi:M24 family metallopeptidase [Streptomyces sp. NPDC089799]|uniref:M24 family metallopeptidase n=1 Tax=Streptomyces sp. NPDC089799 TaxID=3155066 RepID=UPI00344987F0
MTVRDRMDEGLRALRLVEAERMARSVFTHAEQSGVIAAGWYESEVDAAVRRIATRVAGPLLTGPGRLVRSGPHTLLPPGQEVPDRLLGVDDVVVVDLSPLLTGHETGFAQTVVVGEDPGRHRLVEDLRGVFDDVREVFRRHDDLTGRQVHAEVHALSHKAGWCLGSWHAGRMAGTSFTDPPEAAWEEELIAFDNGKPLRRRDLWGFSAHWVLEIHLVDESRGYGGVLKQLLDLG